MNYAELSLDALNIEQKLVQMFMAEVSMRLGLGQIYHEVGFLLDKLFRKPP